MKMTNPFNIPAAIEFDYCRVGIEETRKFIITNRSGAPAKFSIFSEIFTFNPRQGKRCADNLIRNITYRPKDRGCGILYISIGKDYYRGRPSKYQ